MNKLEQNGTLRIGVEFDYDALDKRSLILRLKALEYTCSALMSCQCFLCRWRRRRRLRHINREARRIFG